jgi:hypothetical protein
LETISIFNGIVTLIFDRVTAKSSTSDDQLKSKTQKLENNELKPFWQLRSYDLELCPEHPDGSHLIVLTNQCVKYNDLVTNSFQDNE